MSWEKSKFDIIVIDAETDPFRVGRIPEPFAWGVLKNDQFQCFWGSDSTRECLAWLMRQPPAYVYAHNGGNFDYHLGIARYFRGPITLVNGRILEAKLDDHIVRDSFGLLPFALEAFRKTKIDYQKFERGVRNRPEYRAEITNYLEQDCRDLMKLILAFFDEFGMHLTMATASTKMLSKFHKIERIKEPVHDAFLRQWYKGGRVQCFQSGIIRRPLKVYDVNSMYPHVMKDFKHPIGRAYSVEKKISKFTAFAQIIATNRGAFEIESADRTYLATIHEIEAGIATDTLKVERVLQAVDFVQWSDFGAFVDWGYGKRLRAKKCISEMSRLGMVDWDNRIYDLLYKYILNGAYGKQGTDAAEHFDHLILPNDSEPRDNRSPHAHLHYTAVMHNPDFTIWRREPETLRYYNVATAASITGAARAVLLRGLAASVGAAYCDTDSIICTELPGISEDAARLGAWKLEGKGEWEVSYAAVAGKKLYALFDSNDECVKKASKGARLTPLQIISCAQGGTVEHSNPVPRFKMHGNHQWIVRNIKATAELTAHFWA